jgi:hypothetical protein
VRNPGSSFAHRRSAAPRACLGWLIWLAFVACDSSQRELHENAATATGLLEARILDERGEPVPSVVRIARSDSGVPHPPEGAVDLGPLLQGQGVGDGIRKRVPGKLAGPFWCAPEGGVRAELPPGNWRLTVLHGFEYVPRQIEFEIREGETSELQVGLERWIDAPSLGWWSADDHVHARLTSDLDAEALLTCAKGEDVHVVNILAMGSYARTWFEQRGFGRGFRVRQGNTVLVPGQEDPRTGDLGDGRGAHLGHALALNLGASMVRDPSRYYLYDWMFAAARRQGASVGYAHVAGGHFQVARDMSINVPKGNVDFGEILQFDALDTRLYYEFLNLGLRLAASAGSDFPWGGSIGEARVYAYTDPKEGFDVDRWFEAFSAGRTFVSNGLILDFRVDGQLPGAEIDAVEGQRLSVSARVRGHPVFDTPRELEVVRFGRIVETVSSIDPSAMELALSFEVSADHGFWIAARAFGWDGSAAHSGPVWVVRDDLRPWDHRDVPELLDIRLDQLSDLQRIHARLQGADPHHAFVQQWDGLKARIDEARALYEQWRLLAQEEAAYRR